MSVTPSPIGGFAAQFFDNNGVILSGGKIFTYAAGTTTPQASYTSALGITPHSNPIILDSAGRVPGGEIWLTDGLVYKFVIETATGILLGTYDNITGVNSNFVNYTVQEEVITATAGQTVFNLSTINYTPGTNSLSVYIDGVNQYVGDSYLETDSDTVTFTSGVHVGGEVKFTTAIQVTTGAIDSSIVSYNPPFTGAVGQTVQTKLEQYVSVNDFGAVGDGVTDDTDAIQAAIDYASSLGVPTTVTAAAGGQYLITPQTTINFVGTLTGCCLFIKSNVQLDFGMATILYSQATGGTTIACITNGSQSVSNFAIKNITFQNISGGDVSGSVILLNGGINSDPADFVTDFEISNLQSNKSGLLVHCLHGRTNAVRGIRRFLITDFNNTDSKNCTVYLWGVDTGVVDNIITDGSDFDAVMLFSASDVNVSNIVGKNISENVVGLEARNYSEFIQNVNISNVTSDSGKLGANTVNAGNFVQNITMDNVNIPLLLLDNSGLGQLRRFQINNLKLSTLNTARTAFINKLLDSNISMLAEEGGSSTIETVAVRDCDNIDIDVKIAAALSTTPAFVSELNTRLRAKVSATGGSYALFVRGLLGPTQKSKFDVFASGQTTGAVGYDGTDNVGYDFTVNGLYDGQALQMSNNTSDRGVVNLAYGIGPNVTLASDACAVTNEIHFLVAESGTTDTLSTITGGLKGQTVTIYAVTGTTITVKSATGGSENIFPKGATNRNVTFIAPMVLQYNGTFWIEL
jgi:hypothetical protein